MSIYLIVNVLNVFYHTANAKTVTASDDRSGNYSLNSTGEEGKYESKLADGVTAITITVAQDGYVTTVQKLTLTPGSAAGVTPVIPPGLSFSGTKQELWMRNVGGSSRGTSDWNVEAYFVLGQLTDARDDQGFQINSAGMVLSPISTRVMKFGPNLLDPNGLGWKRFDHTVESASAPGTALYARRLTDPKLIAIFVPDGVVVQPQVDLNDATFKPLNFHLFYHPSPDTLSGSYPMGTAFLDLIARYVYEWPHLNKALVNQQAETSAKPILVFPVGNPSGWMNSFGGQQSILELLLELRFFILRKFNVPYPNQLPGTCAVSGFSAAGAYVNKALIHENDYFNSTVLTEVYGCDLRQVAPATFAKNLSQWRQYNSLLGSKVFRIYTSERDWYDALKGVDPLATPITGKDGAVNLQSAVSSLVMLPFNNFWTNLNQESGFQTTSPDYQILRRNNWDDMHQLYPALFIQHALSLAKFPTKMF